MTTVQLTVAAAQIIINWGNSRYGGSAAAAQSLIYSASQSSYLASQFNAMAAQGGSFKVGLAGSGSSAIGLVVAIDPAAVNMLMGSNIGQKELATLFAHEMGHVLSPGGQAVNLATTPEGVKSDSRTAEGVALGSEMIVSSQLGLGQGGLYSYSDNGQLTSVGGLAQKFNIATNGLNVAELTFGSVQAVQLIQAGGSVVNQLGALSGQARPSIAPNLTYDEYNAGWWAISKCSNIDPQSVDWSRVLPGALVYTQDANGCRIGTPTGIPLLNGAGASFTIDSYITFAGVVSYSNLGHDTNADGRIDRVQVSVDINRDGRFDQFVDTGTSQDRLLNADRQLQSLYNVGQLGSGTWNLYTDWSTALLTSGNTFNNTPNYVAPDLSPIGAFYESKSAGFDAAASIASKTIRVFDGAGCGLTAAQLSALDANADGKLNGAELNGLTAWSDLNEDGILNQAAAANEFTTLTAALAAAGVTSLRASDYAFYTAGNATYRTLAQNALPAPVNATSVLTAPTVGVAPLAALSSYAILRNSDNRFMINATSWIDWSANQIKVSSNQQSMVGTEGSDNFDIGYYAAYNGTYFNLNLVQNFYAGAGNDIVGGSTRNDNIWGGTGNDVLYGYAGDDRLYGEEGNDEIQAGVGNDVLDGSAGDDKLFGQVGNDILVGGDGNDILMGFTASNEPKQTLLAGETDDDTLFGGTGADQMWGGLGNDILDGGADNDLVMGGDGQDTLLGGAGDDEVNGGTGNDALDGSVGVDKMFGGVGNDQLWGGDGADVMLGFTASNEVKQALVSGETDDDLMFGGNGADQMWGGLGNDTVDGGADNDLVMGGDGQDILFAGAGDDEVDGGTGDDAMDGGVGADKLFGGVGNDQMWGGDGNDIMLGFTPVNDSKQSLATGETDNDVMYGGIGDDLLLGGLGDDQQWGGVGVDELQGGEGKDMLYGEDGNDRLFGGAGNDTIYGGNGDDFVVGGAATNEVALAANVSDGNFLYGGAGNDTIIGGVGSDFIDGGAGADWMEGGKGDDTYIVNSVNDVILEQQGEGYDTVVSSSNYILNANIEELRLVEGYTINGTGNSLSNQITGNSQDNILDGVTGADTMIGGLGNDTYYADNASDRAVELVGEGTDTVNSSISYTLGANLENLTLLDFSKAEKGMADGVNTLVYGYPKAFELDYMQGNAVAGYKGTCALTAIANLGTQAKQSLSEAQVVQTAIANQWCVTDAAQTDYQRGGSNYVGQQALLNTYGIRNGVVMGFNEQAIANLVKGGRGVIAGVNAGKLWDDGAYLDNGGVNHVVTVTGVACDAATGAINGFYIADSGRGKVSDMTRYVSIADFRADANVSGAYAIYTVEPIKLWEENINATGNELDNVINGNRGNNLLAGDKGNDTLTGGAGDDTYVFVKGDGQDTVFESDTTVGNTDVLQLSGINQTNLWFKHSGNNLQISVMGTADQITLKDWYALGITGTDNQVEHIKTADGLDLFNTDVERFVQAMAAFAPPLATQTSWASGQTSNGQVLVAVTH